MARLIMTFVFLIFAFCKAKADNQRGFLTALEENLENKLVLYCNNFAKWLENVNDRHLGDSELGQMLNYNVIKPKFSRITEGKTLLLNYLTVTGSFILRACFFSPGDATLDHYVESRGMKKLSMVLLPIIFHVGATSTWLILTALMAAKSVAIGIVLLVFKIAVSSAKVASFFTAWKHNHQHQESWAPHYEHGHYRSIEDAGTHSGLGYSSYNPDPVWNTEYKTLSTDLDPESNVVVDLEEKIDKKT